MGHWLSAAFAHYGYAVVAIGIFFEGCGLPLPGETVLLAGGFFARQGSLSLGWLIVVAFVAAAAGDNTGYWIGRRGGRALVEGHGRWVGLTPRRLEAVDSFFARHGTKTILAARFLSGVRAFAPLFAGISGIPWRRFAAFNLAACVLWSTSIGLLGYVFGESWHKAEKIIGRAGLSVLVIAAGLLLLRATRRHRDRVLLWAREALPDSLTQRELLLLAFELTLLGTLAGLAGRVVAHRANHFDQRVGADVAAWSGPALERFLAFFATLGSAWVVLAVVAAAVVWCVRRRRRAEGAVLGTLYLASVALSVDLGRALDWSGGPFTWLGGLLGGSSLAAATVYGGLALLFSRRQPRRIWPVPVGAGALVLLIAWGRVDAGLDLPSGALAGLAVSILLLLLGNYALERREAKAGQDGSEAAPGAPGGPPPPEGSGSGSPPVDAGEPPLAGPPPRPA
jgi:membrane protein DedA with SNARE-associated domain